MMHPYIIIKLFSQIAIFSSLISILSATTLPFSLSPYYLLPQIKIFYVNFNSISYSMITNVSNVYFALPVPLQKSYGRLGIRATRQY